MPIESRGKSERDSARDQPHMLFRRLFDGEQVSNIKPHETSKFYQVLSGATIIGVLLNFFGIDPIRSLFLSAVVNGVVAAPLMFMFMFMFKFMFMSEKKLIVRQFPCPST
jgi:hypothetical protein